MVHKHEWQCGGGQRDWIPPKTENDEQGRPVITNCLEIGDYYSYWYCICGAWKRVKVKE